MRLIGLVVLLLTLVGGASAQDEVDHTPPNRLREMGGLIQGVQHFRGTVAGEGVYYDLFGLRAGQTVEAYAQGVNGLDTYLAVGDIDFLEVFLEDDDGGPGTDAYLRYTVPEDGDYSLWIAPYDENTSGDYLLVIAVDAPALVNEQAAPETGDTVAVLYIGGSDTLPDANCTILQERPQLSGPMETRETPNFIIHYTTRGEDAATPEYIKEVAEALEFTWEQVTGNMGWPAPPQDCGEGGDRRYDIYIEEITDSEDLLGYAQPEARVGDNPSTPEIEEWAAYSYLAIDNDFNGVERPLSVMRATVAHEFMHSVQYGYDVSDAFFALYEASAAWSETRVFPDDEDAARYAADLFALPDLCLGSEADELRMYGEWLLIESLAMDYGDNVVELLWREMATREGITGFFDALEQRLNVTPEEVVLRWSIRNLLRDYALAARFGDAAVLHVEGQMKDAGDLRPWQDGVQPLGVDYVRLGLASGVYKLTLNGPGLHLYVIGVDIDSGRAQLFDLGTQGTVDFSPYDDLYAMIFNPQRHEDTRTCQPADWTLNVTPSADVGLMPTGETWNASQYVPSG